MLLITAPGSRAKLELMGVLESAWEASVLQLGCVFNDGSPDAQKPVQDASHTVQRTTGHFGFELLPTNRRVKSRHRRASATSRGPRAEALCPL